jgi:hypothetical protein
MSESTALILRNDALQKIEFTGQALALKSDALEKSALIGKVENADEQNAAVEAQRDLTTIRRDVEKARVAAKAPVIAFGRHIDECAKQFDKELADEEMRLATLVGSYQQLLAAKAKAEEQARRLEAERIERQAREEQQRIYRAEQDRLEAIRREEQRLEQVEQERKAAAKREADKALQKIQEAKNAEARKKAEAEAAEKKRLADIADAAAREQAERNAVELQRQKELATAQTHQALDEANARASDAQAAIESVPTSAPSRAEGQRVIENWVVTVTDVWTLARAHPACVKIEPCLSEIKALLNMGVKVAGVSAAKEIKSGVTTKRTAGAIDV